MNEVKQVRQFLFFKGTEHSCARVAARIEADAEAENDHLPNETTLDFQLRQARRELPDVRESDAGEVTAPAAGDGNAAQDGGDAVAERLPHVEALVAVLPHAVGTVRVVWLTNDILEAHLVSRNGCLQYTLWSTANMQL